MSLTLTQAYDSEKRAFFHQAARVLAGSLLMALAAQFTIPLQPIPITLQTFAAILLGGALGKREGALAVFLYLLQIAIGLPVAAGGIVNPLILVGPRAGYFLGMVVQAYLVGWYVEKRSHLSSGQTVGFLLLVCLIQLLLGTAVLALFLGVEAAFIYGFVPFIATETIKSAIAMRILLKSRG